MVKARHPNNEWYEELCALAAIGELSKSEFEDLQRHLQECGDCRELHADFRRLSADDLGLLAVREQLDRVPQEPAAELDQNALLSRFLDRARREGKIAAEVQLPLQRQKPPLAATWLSNWLPRPMLAYAALAVVLCTATAICAYRLRDAQLSPAVAQLRSQLNAWKDKAQATTAAQQSAAGLLHQSESSREQLQKSLADLNAKLAADEIQKNALESQLATARTQADETNRALEAAKVGASDKDSKLAQLEAKLDEAVRRTSEEERTADDLRSELALSEASAKVSAAAPPTDDAQASNLFGARDLHIVDVYDVDASGETKRTYGRVYYVEKKLLVFYAFDLDKNRHRAPADFQAWGYRQANQSKPDNLGLFNVDNASLNRWVLKVNDPHVLEHIDAVFVTMEPPNGSASPKGRRLLYANLAGPANHP